MLAEGFILMVFTEIWKRIVKKFGIEMSRVIIHTVLFGVCLIYAILKYFGYWDVMGVTLIGIWATASGLYEITKTIIERVVSQS